MSTALPKSTVLDGRADGRCPCAPHQQLSVPEQLAGLDFRRVRSEHGNDTGLTNNIINVIGINCGLTGMMMMMMMVVMMMMMMMMIIE